MSSISGTVGQGIGIEAIKQIIQFTFVRLFMSSISGTVGQCIGIEAIKQNHSIHILSPELNSLPIQLTVF